jgi:hypothetical protein
MRGQSHRIPEGLMHKPGEHHPLPPCQVLVTEHPITISFVSHTQSPYFSMTTRSRISLPLENLLANMSTERPFGATALFYSSNSSTGFAIIV